MARACAIRMVARHYTELECWQLAHELKLEVFAFTAKLPAKADRDFCHDIRRSARSAPANIAEGFGRETHRDFANFLAIARASLMETENHLGDALECEYITHAEHKRLTILAHRALGATTGLQSYLLLTPDRRRRAKPPMRRSRV
jgi:four helix bundle protein